MSNGVLACPTTQKPIAAKISNDPAVMQRAWNKTLKIKCLHCGETHRIAFRDAYVAAVLNGTRIGPPGVTGSEARRRARAASSSVPAGAHARQQKVAKSRRAKQLVSAPE